MSVSFSKICQVVEDREMIISPNPEKTLINLKSTPPKKNLSSDYLYALKASYLKKYKNLENMSLVVYEDVPLSSDYYRISGLNIILTQDSESFQHLKTDIQSIFDEQAIVNNYAYNLMTLCHQDANREKLLEAGYCFLKNPLLLVDTSLALISCVGVYSGIKDSVINYCLDNGHFPTDFLDDMIDGQFPPIDENFPELIILEKGAKEHVNTSIVAARVVRGNQLLGYLKLFEYNHPVTSLEKECLIILSDFISIALTDSLPRLPINNLQIEDFMTDLLSKRISSTEAIEARTFLYHLNENEKQVVVSIKYNTQKANKDRLYFIKKQLQNMFNISTITFFDQLIVLILPCNILEKQRKNLLSFLATHNLTSGISLPFYSYADLFRHYKQTLACLEMQIRFSLKDVLIDYNDWKLIHIFIHFQECCDLNDLIPEEIHILENIDKTKGTNLVETLFTYVHHKQSITEAACELHLHYNTMKYRIDQIVELTNIDFDDYNYMFNIIIAEKVMNIFHKTPSVSIPPDL